MNGHWSLEVEINVRIVHPFRLFGAIQWHICTIASSKVRISNFRRKFCLLLKTLDCVAKMHFTVSVGFVTYSCTSDNKRCCDAAARDT